MSLNNFLIPWLCTISAPLKKMYNSDYLGIDSQWTVMVQFIASAPTLFPAEYVEEFQNCFDRAPAVPYDVIESILREELQRPLDSVYEYIDPVPIASASIAQVSPRTFWITLCSLLHYAVYSLLLKH